MNRQIGELTNIVLSLTGFTLTLKKGTEKTYCPLNLTAEPPLCKTDELHERVVD